MRVDIKRMLEKRAEMHKKMTDILDKAKVEERALTVEEESEFNKLAEEINRIDATNEAEERASKITKTVLNVPASIEEMEERAVSDYIKGIDSENRANFTLASNGAIAPTQIINKIISKVIEISPVYSMATKYNIAGNMTIPYYDNDTSSITVGLAQEFNELTASAGSFKSITLGGELVGALSLISKSLINKADFNVTSYAIEKMAEGFAGFIENSSLNGIKNKIDGLSTGVTQSVETNSATAITADDLIDVQEAIPDVYQANAVWIMSRSTRTKIRKLKDSDGNYLLNRDVSSKWGYTLLGKDVYISQNMPDIAAGATTIYYGDFSGLAIKNSEQLEINVLREKYATQHCIGVYGYTEFDAKVENAQKLSKLVMKST